MFTYFQRPFCWWIRITDSLKVFTLKLDSGFMEISWPCVLCICFLQSGKGWLVVLLNPNSITTFFAAICVSGNTIHYSSSVKSCNSSEVHAYIILVLQFDDVIVFFSHSHSHICLVWLGRNCALPRHLWSELSEATLDQWSGSLETTATW